MFEQYQLKTQPVRALRFQGMETLTAHPDLQDVVRKLVSMVPETFWFSAGPEDPGNYIRVGDWLVENSRGKFQCMTDPVFRKNYVKVEQQEDSPLMWGGAGL